MSNVQLNKIIISVGDKPIELTLDEATELKDILKELLGDSPEKEIVYIPSVFEEKHPYRITKIYPIWRWYPEITTGTITISNGNYSGTTTIIPNSNNVTPTI